MLGRPVIMTLPLLAAIGLALADDDSRLTIRSEAARVEIPAIPEGRRLIRLPRLDFRLIIEPQCAGNSSVESVSISVADTRRRYDTADFADQSVLETSLSLPRRQTGRLAIEQFCTHDEESSDRSLLIPDAFTAQASLRCAGEAHQAMIYEAVRLGVRLLCKAPETTSESAGKNQESSSTTPSL